MCTHSTHCIAQYVQLIEKGMLHRNAIRNYLYLARTEMYNHQAPFDVEPLEPLVAPGLLRALFVSAGEACMCGFWAPPSDTA